MLSIDLLQCRWTTLGGKHHNRLTVATHTEQWMWVTDDWKLYSRLDPAWCILSIFFCEQIMVQPWAGYNLNVFCVCWQSITVCFLFHEAVQNPQLDEVGKQSILCIHAYYTTFIQKNIEISPEVCHSYSKTKVVTFFWSMILYNTCVKQPVTQCTQQLFTYACGLLYTGTKCIHLLPHCSTFTDTIWQGTTGFMS